MKSLPVVFISIVIGVALVSAGCAPEVKRTTSPGDGRKIIRFYSVTKHGVQDKLSMIKRTEIPGCHDLSRFRRVYRVAVIGFKNCRVFAEPGCPEDQVIAARWDSKHLLETSKDKMKTTLTQGSQWFVGDATAKKPNVAIRSWSCEE